jgi:heat shock protein HslJ
MALINTTTTGILGTTLFGDGSGDLTIQRDGVTINKITAAPAFSAFRSSSQQTVSNSTWTKIQFNSEEFDTASCYDNTTNYRFTPNVSGYYQCNWMIQFDNSVSTLMLTSLYKNGTSFKRGEAITGGSYSAGGSALVYMNGTTDYIEAYIYQASGGNRATDGGASTFFQAHLIGAA